MPANIGEMFYYGTVPWHKRGKKVDTPLTVEDALKYGGLDWGVEKVHLLTAENPPSPAFSRIAIVRNDRDPGHEGRVVGVTHPDFKPLQNREGALIFDAIFGHGQPVYHTGGYLKNGEVVWLLAKVPTMINVFVHDVVAPYALFSNSHDGSTAIDFRLTTIRVVCQNTLSLALHNKDISTFFKHAHQGNYSDLKKEAGVFFDETMQAIKGIETTFRAMAAVPFSREQMGQYIEELFPKPKEPEGVSKESPAYSRYITRTRNIQGARAKILDLSEHGKGADLRGVKGTLWGGFNSVIEYVDHHHWSGSNSLIEGIFGTKATFKRRVYETALEYLLKAA